MTDRLKMYLSFVSFIIFLGTMFLFQEGSILFYTFGITGSIFFFVAAFFFLKIKLKSVFYLLKTLFDRIKDI
jgi:hypothetical protein